MIGGIPIPEAPDLPRMRRERLSRLQDGMARSGHDAMLLLGSNSVAYATGAVAPGMDGGLAHYSPAVALVVRGDVAPHVWTSHPDGLPQEIDSEHVHRPEHVAFAEGAARVAACIMDILGSGAKVACDELTHPLREALAGIDTSGASALLGGAKLCKTPDEIACIRRAQRINESAMSDVQPLLRAGVRQCDLTGVFLRRVAEMGATANAIDPIWQAMPRSLAEGPWTAHGDVAFPTPSTDRFLREGEVVWVDTGIQYQGYASDFGRTWIVGAGGSSAAAPNARQRAQHDRWHEVVSAALAVCKPGATALELVRAATAANGGRKPWLEHFYLAHGVGTDSAEMPLVGTDLGEAFDERLVLQPGMVLVFEPVIWEDGFGGYRSEDIVAVTDDGWVQLSSYPYDPFEAAW